MIPTLADVYWADDKRDGISVCSSNRLLKALSVFLPGDIYDNESLFVRKTLRRSSQIRQYCPNHMLVTGIIR